MVQIESGATDTAKSIDRRRDIVHAAGEVFRRHGVHHAGMREIAAACGMQVGNLYYWFENKASLVAFCQRDSLDGLLATAAWVRQLNVPPDSQLFLLLVAHVRRLNEWSPGSLAHLEAEGLDGAAREELLGARDRYARELEAVLDAGIRTGIFRHVDPRVAVLGALGSTNWTVRWFRQDGPRSAHSIGVELAEMIVRGLLTSGRDLNVPNDETYVALERVALELR